MGDLYNDLSWISDLNLGMGCSNRGLYNYHQNICYQQCKHNLRSEDGAVHTCHICVRNGWCLG